MISLRQGDQDAIASGVLVYAASELAFATESCPLGSDGSLSVNLIQLMADRGQSRILYVEGYSNYRRWVRSDLNVPVARTAGIVYRSDHPLLHGGALGLNDPARPWPETIDTSSGWLCIGDLAADGSAIEFAPGAIATLKDDQLVALWLHPRELPASFSR